MSGIRNKSFTPSYPVSPGEPEAYRQAVLEGLKRDPDGPEPDLDLHIMVHGGRKTLNRGEEVPVLVLAQTAKRLGTGRDNESFGLPPYHARTQSLKAAQRAVERRLGGSRQNEETRTAARAAYSGGVTRGKGDVLDSDPAFAEDRLAAQIRDALDRYRSSASTALGGASVGQLGLVVPDTPHRLVAFGVPEKAARLLVERAAGKLYVDLPGSTTKRLLGPPSFQQRLLVLLGNTLTVRAGRIVLPLKKERQRAAELRRVLLARPGSPAQVLAYGVENAPRLSAGKTTRPRFPVYLRDEYEKRKQQLLKTQKVYDEAVEDLEFVAAQTRLWDAVLQKAGPRSSLVFVFEGLGEGRFHRQLLWREHSNVDSRAENTPVLRYKTLENVSLSDLPVVLARLARRKKRKGRLSIPLSARSNPGEHPRMSDSNALLNFVVAEMAAGRLVPAEGKPGRVYWPAYTGAGPYKRLVGFREPSPTAGQAEQWLHQIVARGRALATSTSQENPMGRRYTTDDDFFRAQYDKSPFGARAELPMVRRNPATTTARFPGTCISCGGAIVRGQQLKDSGRRGPKGGVKMVHVNCGAIPNKGKARAASPAKRKGNPQAAKAMHRAQQIMQSQGCSMRQALSTAWREIKGGSRAAANPWFNDNTLYLPDTTQTRSSLVPGKGDRDLTQRRSALVEGPYAWNNPKVGARFGDGRLISRLSPGWEDGWDPDFASQLKGMGRRMNAAQLVADSKAMAARQMAESAQADAEATQRQMEIERFRNAQEAARKVGSAWGRDPLIRGPYAERWGQWSPNMTGGFAPVARRNSSKKRRK